jgi:SPP1 family predicted phage head-tail adaptor
MFKDVINIISIVNTVDEGGDTVQVETPRQVFANKKSIKQSEYYQALSVGLKPEVTFEIYSFEYEDERKLTYETKPYNIIRTFEKGDFVELICEAVV